MLDELTNLLRVEGLVAAGIEPVYDITIVTPHMLNIGVHVRNGGYFHVRVKEAGKLPAEYKNYCDAHRAFPRFVPEPVCRRVTDEWEILVVRGIRHRSIAGGSIAAGADDLVSSIAAFLEASNTGARVTAAPESHATFLRRMRARATDPVSANILLRWEASEQLEQLPCIKQHGDFVINNLGLARTGLVVFDWEDFGRVSLAGLDLCTLIASDAAFDPAVLRSVFKPARSDTDRYASLMRRACPAIGLSTELFRKLVPLYLVIFLDLKSDIQNYGPAIGQLVRTAIHALEES